MISDAVRGFIDKRSSIPGAAKVVPSPQAENVHEFFLGLYTSAAKPLPHERYMVKGSVDANIKFDEQFRCSGEEIRLLAVTTETQTMRRKFGTQMPAWFRASLLSLAETSECRSGPSPEPHSHLFIG